jgi:DNA helicase-2/ATP-dependent DNA helicase PcrA
MRFFTDLHLHSRFSRACSKRLTLPEIYKWCQFKGITIIGTADFTHPVWMKEIQEQLEEAEEGLFRLKNSYADEIDNIVPQACKADVRFMLSVEISLIYKRDEKVRKIHHVILMPSIHSAIEIRENREFKL